MFTHWFKPTNTFTDWIFINKCPFKLMYIQGIVWMGVAVAAPKLHKFKALESKIQHDWWFMVIKSWLWLQHGAKKPFSCLLRTLDLWAINLKMFALLFFTATIIFDAPLDHPSLYLNR